ncbi:cuticle protein 7-like [Penaeus indicus]|uniref:cuticle protein 7-like n=1 Tax=Penaeus indicus TaxID=29960 RepID=UPI00300D9720
MKVDHPERRVFESCTNGPRLKGGHPLGVIAVFDISNRMAFKVLALATLVVATVALPDSPPTYSYSAPTPSYAPAKYDFNYAVNDPPSGNDFGHQEARDGDNTQGSYYVLLPDGRLQRVTYNVNGDSGYVADVTYEGEARYPTPKASYGPPQPSYKPPTPSYA